MKALKTQLLLSLLFITIGIAVVTTNLIANVSTPISSNQDDFLVYFSNVLVDRVQNLSLVRNEKTLVFNSEFSAVGDKVTIDYDVTNASKNYDARISINCTGGNNYLKVTNSFDEKNDLTARSTKTGTLTVELINAVSTETSYEIQCTITGTAVERETEGIGEVSGKIYKIGQEISIGNEKFNVISQTDTTVTLFAQYNLGTNYRQSEDVNLVKFSNSNGWEYTPGPKDIDIQQYEGGAKTYINEYVAYLNNLTDNKIISGNLITLTQLIDLGCTIPDDYDLDDMLLYDCFDSPYESWIANNQFWWTSSASNRYSDLITYVDGMGHISNNSYYDSQGIRPIIVIAKNDLENLN